MPSTISVPDSANWPRCRRGLATSATAAGAGRRVGLKSARSTMSRCDVRRGLRLVLGQHDGRHGLRRDHGLRRRQALPARAPSRSASRSARRARRREAPTGSRSARSMAARSSIPPLTSARRQAPCPARQRPAPSRPSARCSPAPGPAAGLNPRNAFRGRIVRLSTTRYGVVASSACRILASAGVDAKNWTLTVISLNRPSSRATGTLAGRDPPAVVLDRRAHEIGQFGRGKVRRRILEEEPASVPLLHRVEGTAQFRRLRRDAAVALEAVRERVDRLVVVPMQQQHRADEHDERPEHRDAPAG